MSDVRLRGSPRDLVAAALLLLAPACVRAPEDTSTPWGEALPFADALPTGADPAPPPGVAPSLSVTPLVPGRAATWTVSSLDPNEWVYIGRAFTTSGPVLCPPALGGLCLDLHGGVQLHARVRANAAGVATITATVPSTVALGLDLYFQAAAVRGVGGVSSVKSNVVATEVTEPADTFLGSSGLTSRPSNPTCVAPDRPLTDLTMQLTRVYSTATLSLPTTLIQPPGDDTVWYAGELDGRVRRFPNVASPTATTAMDITSRVVSGGELGLLGMAFDPDYPASPYLYVSYTGGTSGSPVSRVSRFTTTDGGLTFQPSSEAILLSVAQPFSNHNGGHIVFGPDGYLYFGLGDGGSANDPLNHGQNPSTLLGSMLRVDVQGTTYTIPPDNPFATGVGGAPEVWAWGLRNPWRWSFDRQTGQLWAGDVGQNAWEEIDILTAGGNFGWRVMEGFDCANPPGCDDPSFVPPVHVYPHTGGSASVIGGYVYRGAAMPHLQGVYTYAEFYTGEVFGLFPDGAGAYVADRLAQRTGMQASTFAEDQAGELYLADYAGRVYKLTQSAPPFADPFPQHLSATGCFEPTDPTVPMPGLIPYAPRVELWSDGLEKRRWMALPDGTQVTVGADGDFQFPIGTVLAKEFRHAGAPVETRLFMRHSDGGWGAYTYVWNAAGTDAELVTAGQTVSLAGGGTWEVPSQAQCFQCHTAAAGDSLGLEVAQLNSDLDYGAGPANQLDTLDLIDLLDAPLPNPATLPALSLLAGPDSAEQRARAYLHANCQSCHRPGGPGLGGIDLRWDTAFADTGTCDAVPSAGSLGIPGARIVKPGDPTASVLYARMLATGDARMPRLGTSVVHTQATDTVADWILSIAACPP